MRKLKESVLKMGGKQYKGEKYTFCISDKQKPIGKGGNGKVFAVIAQETDTPLVAKFFCCRSTARERNKRYQRFINEVDFYEHNQTIEGLMPILDKHCPINYRKNDNAWFIMPRAEEYRIKKRSFLEIIDNMLCLAKIIQNLHKNFYAHRDIKPENILFLEGNIVLSDFGLIWGYSDERITGPNEKIGPYKILPPELESVNGEETIDFRPSDVYLFAKNLWMNIKEDNNGFRGPYNRKDIQIYLDKNRIGVITLEPIHMLLEGATHDDLSKRIDINECIHLLMLQKEIIINPDSPGLSTRIKAFVFDENRKEVVAQSEPTELVYEDTHAISRMLNQLLSISNVYVNIKNSIDGDAEKQINASRHDLHPNNECIFYFDSNGGSSIRYHMYIKRMVCSPLYDEITLELDVNKNPPSGYIRYGSKQLPLPNMQYYLTNSENIILRK